MHFYSQLIVRRREGILRKRHPSIPRSSAVADETWGTHVSCLPELGHLPTPALQTSHSLTQPLFPLVLPSTW
jgi:hypothetical protein